MKDIEFSIGPADKQSHDDVLFWLANNSYSVKVVSHQGDHYSEIHVFGDYNKAHMTLSNKKGISFEHWEE